ncbi:MAG TPA: nucleotidyltransferase domain-containing protein [Candidatus Omnitrophota bacterium]|nr:nucleotidyltransferase domain-containing protein [Candidatus Omnitrophota bacterium]
MKNINNIKKKVIGILDKFLGRDYLLVVFGSFARGKADNLSDIDLAVYRESIIPLRVILELREELDETAPTLRQIELVNLTDDNINTDLIKNILEEGVIWKRPRNLKGPLTGLRKRLLNLRK